MRTTLIAIALAAFCAVTPAAAQTSFEGVKAATHDCATNSTVTVNANEGTFQFQGLCEKIAVNGVGNRVTVEGAKTLEVTGDNNTVTLKAASTITIRGSGNSVTYDARLPGMPLNARARGNGNAILPKE